MNKMTIRLEDCRFYAYHGVMPQENIAGNEFVAGVTVEYASDENIDDDIGNTVSYADLYEILRTEMGKPRKLLETVAKSIAGEIRQRFPQLSKIEVCIRKITPPIPGINGSASVTFTLTP